MKVVVRKFRDSLRDVGVIGTFMRALKYPFHKQVRARHAEFEDMIKADKPGEDRFTLIYKRNLWGSKESLSGFGSTLEYTKNLRNELIKLIEDRSIKTMFDAPCGDFNWMKHVLAEVDITYIGGDVVFPLIQAHSSKYRNDRLSFLHIDLTKDKYPSADLMICRDCLFHLSFTDTQAVLQNFVDSDIRFLLTSTHKNLNGFVNEDIQTGRFRLTDLFSSPYYFSADVLARIDDWIPPHPEREMCLWSNDQIREALARFKESMPGSTVA